MSVTERCRRRGGGGRWAPAAVLTALVLAVSTPAAAWAVPASESWAAELAVGGGDDTGVVVGPGGPGGQDAVRLADTAPRATSTGSMPAEGELLLPPRRVGAVTDRVAADVTAEEPAGSQVVVSVRGLRDDGSWGQWTTAAADAPAPLGTTTLQVQVRVTLVAGPGGASPALTRLWLTADRGPTGAPGTTATEPFAAPVFATRIGLVGQRTANGHRITGDDRFVALPSRRALAPDGTGDYTVRLCTSVGRCTWAPVWDVGPWNTHDDHWNPAGVRERHDDLPRGVPQARAAHDDGYDDGRDESGREVTNPAGIDLADGTFADLGMSDNATVTATYLWTGTGPAGSSGDDVLTVRSAPADDASAVGTIAPHARVPVACTTADPTLALSSGTPARWLRVGTGQYVPADDLEVPDDVGVC